MSLIAELLLSVFMRKTETDEGKKHNRHEVVSFPTLRGRHSTYFAALLICQLLSASFLKGESSEVSRVLGLSCTLCPPGIPFITALASCHLGLFLLKVSS